MGLASCARCKVVAVDLWRRSSFLDHVDVEHSVRGKSEVRSGLRSVSLSLELMASLDTDPEGAEHLPVLRHVVDRIDGIHRGSQALLYILLAR